MVQANRAEHSWNGTNSPFQLSNEQAYARWRSAKLADYPLHAGELMVEVENPLSLTAREHQALLQRCRKANSVLYAWRGGGSPDKAVPRVLGEQLGLRRMDGNLCADDDGITSLRVREGGGSRHEGYIPYSNRPLNWHTDGYYNRPDERIQAMLLHCVSDAAVGGENELLDHEIVYLLMRDEDPALVEALMAPDAMTIPANVENGVQIRPARTGPVFRVDPETGNLHMRYTARKRNIEWKQTVSTVAAVEFLEELLAGGSRYIIRHRLEPGQGIISNNALHNRTGFSDDGEHGKRRLIYRARYHDRIAATDLDDIYQ